MYPLHTCTTLRKMLIENGADFDTLEYVVQLLGSGDFFYDEDKKIKKTIKLKQGDFDFERILDTPFVFTEGDMQIPLFIGKDKERLFTLVFHDEDVVMHAQVHSLDYYLLTKEPILFPGE